MSKTSSSKEELHNYSKTNPSELSVPEQNFTSVKTRIIQLIFQNKSFKTFTGTKFYISEIIFNALNFFLTNSSSCCIPYI